MGPRCRARRPAPKPAGSPPQPSRPLSGAFVRIHSVVQILDRKVIRDNQGFVSPDTMNTVEAQFREFLDLP
ncbi:hypothetical protein GCM10010435_37210 [Winogradskya consettensis]|uniref:Uncharacterized protein n=1 Tax=Winogradskya consettensis TaxID=113560 RepID=A0A919W6M0_9ACTN|nr:hypothetical protein Aco04nite_88890 [Actinoplanes consettensis]